MKIRNNFLLLREQSKEELLSLSHKKLYYHYILARAKASYILVYYGRRCCEICHEYIGINYQEDVIKPWEAAEEYRKLVLSVLQSLPYVNYNAKNPNLSKEKGNRLPKKSLQNKSNRKPYRR